MLTKFIVRLNRFSAFMTLFFAMVLSTDCFAFDWTQKYLKVEPFTLDKTKQQEVFSTLLGPTFLITGDGGDGAQMCYLQEYGPGQELRVVLSFFGSDPTSVVTAVDLQLLKRSTDPWIRRVCRTSKVGTVSTGLVDGVKIGDARASTRKLLGTPTKHSPTRDEYEKITTTPTGDMLTRLELDFDVKGKLTRFFVSQVETD